MKTTDDVVLYSKDKEENMKYKTGKTPPQSPIVNSNTDPPEFVKTDSKDGGRQLLREEAPSHEEFGRNEKEVETYEQVFQEICEGKKEKLNERDEEETLDQILNGEHESKIEDRT